ncbi:MAG TPA: diguanylate cyclase [Candidatus Babeliales bacterium]|nr:diguanylate cyclase [Candidatus Babeliales bacterium]
MLLEEISHDEIQKVMAQLDQAIYNHQQWHNSLIRTLICRLQSDENDIDTNAHKKCRFGQWYFNHAPEKLHEHPGFIAIGTAHQHMHELTTRLLNTSNAGNLISPLEFDNFANALERLRLEIFALKNELEMLLYNRDPLTMAITRISMLPILREQQALVTRQAQPCCIVMMDLDLFKKINDLYGHPAGDKVLTALAHLISQHLRPYDKLFRYGGEEFLLCIPQIDLHQGYEMIERLRQAIAAMNIDLGLQAPINITVSAGLTLLDPSYPVEQSIDRADKAMYAAKSAGRNCTKIWDVDM